DYYCAASCGSGSSWQFFF
nr:immunoglobulin light chain junction region [Macaca mulatta]